VKSGVLRTSNINWICRWVQASGCGGLASSAQWRRPSDIDVDESQTCDLERQESEIWSFRFVVADFPATLDVDLERRENSEDNEWMCVTCELVG